MRIIPSLILLVSLFVTSFAAMAESKVDINKADVKEMSTLSNIGEKKAQDIVTYRETHGDFKSVDELTKVKGIGAATIEKNRERLFVVQN